MGTMSLRRNDGESKPTPGQATLRVQGDAGRAAQPSDPGSAAGGGACGQRGRVGPAEADCGRPALCTRAFAAGRVSSECGTGDGLDRSRGRMMQGCGKAFTRAPAQVEGSLALSKTPSPLSSGPSSLERCHSSKYSRGSCEN